MIGDIVFVYRQLGLTEALELVFDYLNENSEKSALEDLVVSFPGFEIPTGIWLAANATQRQAFLSSLAAAIPANELSASLISIIWKYFPPKQAMVFISIVLFGYRHYGIEVDSFAIVHFSGTTSNLGKDATVQKARGRVFLADGKMCIDLIVKPAFTKREIADRALGMLGQDFGGYDAFTNNCEHFTAWCATGSKDSRQAIFWNQGSNAPKNVYNRIRDFLLDLSGEQARALTRKAEEDEAHSAAMIEHLVKIRQKFEARLQDRTSTFSETFHQQMVSLDEALALGEYQNAMQSLRTLSQLFGRDLKHFNFDEFKSIMEDDEQDLIL